MASLSAQQVAVPASDRGNCRCSSSATDKTFCPTHSTGQCHVCGDINIMFHLISLSFLVNDFDFFFSSCAKEERKKKKKNLLFADLPESPDARGVQVRCSQFFCTTPTPTPTPNPTELLLTGWPGGGWIETTHKAGIRLINKVCPTFRQGIVIHYQ